MQGGDAGDIVGPSPLVSSPRCWPASSAVVWSASGRSCRNAFSGWSRHGSSWTAEVCGQLRVHPQLRPVY